MGNTTFEPVVEKMRHQIKRSWGCELQPPCPASELQALSERIRLELGVLVPVRYLDFLKICDGMLENALDIFGSRTTLSLVSPIVGYEVYIRGIIETNIEYRDNVEDYKQLLIFAYREGDIYAQVNESGLFIKLSETEDEPRETYETFDEMIIAAIQSALVE